MQVHTDQTRYLMVLNIILRKCMDTLKLAKVGREFYDPQGEIKLQQWKLALWPGYTTSIRQHDTKILLNCDTKFKVRLLKNLKSNLRSSQRRRQSSRSNWSLKTMRHN